jgi:hypothetical protein
VDWEGAKETQVGVPVAGPMQAGRMAGAEVTCRGLTLGGWVHEEAAPTRRGAMMIGRRSCEGISVAVGIGIDVAAGLARIIRTPTWSTRRQRLILTRLTR